MPPLQQGLSQEEQEALNAFYTEVERQAEPLRRHHAERLQCRAGCAQCCQDELTVFEVEAAFILQSHASWLEQAAPHPAGGCAFLDEQQHCRIYHARPYVCRTQGLPLRWFEEIDEESAAELRDICPLNEAGPPLEELPEAEFWTIGPFEASLAGLQQRFRRSMKRVPLRSLFGRNA